MSENPPMNAEKDAPAQCRYMAAAYPELTVEETCYFAEHRHDEQTFALALAMAMVCQNPDPSDEQIAWFLEDAAAVVDDFDPTPAKWVVTEPQTATEFGLDFTLTINGAEYVIPESEWEPSHPVSLAEWRRWHDDEDEEAPHA